MDKQRFQALSASELAEWLEDHLLAAQGAEARLRELAELGIRGAESDFEAIIQLFESLDRAAQRKFQGAIESLLRRAPDTYTRGVMKELVLLVGATRAYDALPALLPVLGAGVWGERAPELFYYALSALKGLKQDALAYDTTKRLVTTANFPARYAFDAFEILIGAHPERWLEDFKQVEGLLRRAQEEGGLPPDALAARYERLAEEVADAVQLHDIAGGLPELLSWQYRLNGLHSASPAGQLCAALTRGALIISDGQDLAVSRGEGASSPIRNLGAAGELYLDQLLTARGAQEPVNLPHFASWSPI